MSDVDIVRDALPRCPDHGKQNWAEGGCPGCVAAGSALAALDRLEAERDTLRDELAEARREAVEHREGMMEVYDWTGRYAGCIGSETWTQLVMEAKAGAA